jgi:hypothetical protein
MTPLTDAECFAALTDPRRSVFRHYGTPRMRDLVIHRLYIPERCVQYRLERPSYPAFWINVEVPLRPVPMEDLKVKGSLPGLMAWITPQGSLIIATQEVNFKVFMHVKKFLPMSPAQSAQLALISGTGTADDAAIAARHYSELLHGIDANYWPLDAYEIKDKAITLFSAQKRSSVRITFFPARIYMHFDPVPKARIPMPSSLPAGYLVNSRQHDEFLRTAAKAMAKEFPLLTE